MQINTFRYTPKDVNCKLCTEYRGKRNRCPACPWIAERIEAGAVGYEEAVRDAFPRDKGDDPHLDGRLNAVIFSFPGSMFLDGEHRKRMEELKIRMGFRRRRDTPAWYAAMYLLTSNRTLRDRSVNCFCKHGIEFRYATVKGISPHDYTLLSAAKDLYSGASGIELNALVNKEVVDTLAFTLIINAVMIARYGCAVLEIRERRRT